MTGYRLGIVVLGGVFVLLYAGTALAGPRAEDKCQAGKNKEAGKLALTRTDS